MPPFFPPFCTLWWRHAAHYRCLARWFPGLQSGATASAQPNHKSRFLIALRSKPPPFPRLSRAQGPPPPCFLSGMLVKACAACVCVEAPRRTAPHRTSTLSGRVRVRPAGRKHPSDWLFPAFFFSRRVHLLSCSAFTFLLQSMIPWLLSKKKNDPMMHGALPIGWLHNPHLSSHTCETSRRDHACSYCTCYLLPHTHVERGFGSAPSLHQALNPRK